MKETAHELVLGIGVVALLVTKALDVHSTLRHVGAHGETNPLAAAWFRRFGLVRGVWLVCAIYLAILLAQTWLVAWIDVPTLTWATFVCCIAIAWVQWEVARTNRTGKYSRVTRTVLSLHSAWAKRR